MLVNNAGEIPSGPIESLTEDDWRRGFELKVFGYITLTREIYGRMKARSKGVIINDIGNSGENWDASYIAGSHRQCRADVLHARRSAARASTTAFASSASIRARSRPTA